MNSISGKLVMAAALVLAVQTAHAAAPGDGQPITAEAVIANNDQDKDGMVTKAEATAAARQLAQSWDTFDTNKDGKVDVEEVRKVLAGINGGAPAGAPPAAAPPVAVPPAAAPPAAK